MPVSAGTAFVDIRPDLSEFGRNLRRGVLQDVNRTGNDASKTLSQSFAKAAQSAAAAFGTAFAAVKIKDFFGGAIDAASDLNESITKVGVVFGTSAIQVRSFAETAADSIGQSEQQALEATGTFGNLFVSMGLGGKSAADMSINLVKLASDLASFNNVDPTDALDALRSGLVGETEPLRRFGVNLNEATLKQKALELGLKTTGATLDPVVKAQAAYALILEQTTTAQGDFARTADGLANQQRTMTAQWADAKAELGEGLLPIMISVAGFINDELIPAFKTFFVVGEGDATSWAAKMRDAIGDTLGFLVGALQQTLRLMANVATKLPLGWGDEAAADLRAAADGADEFRTKLHASTAELNDWAGATRNSDAAAKLLAPAVTAAGRALKDSIGPTKESEKATKDAAKAERDLLGAKRDVADAQRGLTKAQQERDKAAAAFAILGTDTAKDALAEADENLADAKDAVADATDRQIDTQDKIAELESKATTATAAFVKGINDRTEALKALNEQFGITEGHLGILGDTGNILGGLKGAAIIPPPTPASVPVPTFPTFNPSLGVAPSTNLGISVPNIPRPVTNNLTVNTVQPPSDPAQLSKEIAWAIAGVL